LLPKPYIIHEPKKRGTMNHDQIKAVAAEFLLALATVPGLFDHWQTTQSPAARAQIVMNVLGLQHLPTAEEIALMAELAKPRLAQFDDAGMPAMMLILAHPAEERAA
jgi:hypothetical protein